MLKNASPETPAGRTGDPSACPCVSRSKHAFGPHGRPSSVPVRDAKPGTSSGRTGGLPTCPTPACSGREAPHPSSGLGAVQHVKLTHVGGGVRQQCVRKNVGRRLRVLTLASTCSVALRLYGSRHCLVLSTIRLHQMESNGPLSKHDDVVIATQRHAAELRHLAISLCEIKQAVSKVPSQGVTLITPHSSVCRPSLIVFKMTAGNELPPNLFADSCTSDKDLTFFTIRTLCVNATC